MLEESMSIASINFDCNKCDYSSSNLSLYNNYKYVIGGSTVKYLSCKLGWCNNCKGIVAVEDFGDCNTDYEEIRDLADYLISGYNGNRVITSDDFKEDCLDKLHKILELNEHIRFRNLRKDTEKCLSCGSEDILPFNADYKLEYNSWLRQYLGKKKTGFLHPNCGGEIIASGSGHCYALSRNPKYYNWNGIQDDMYEKSSQVHKSLGLDDNEKEWKRKIEEDNIERLLKKFTGK
jgi:hypothetical protein